MKRALLAFTFLVPLSAFALDWKQPILDEFDKTVPDCKIDQTTRAYENCGKVLTLGTLAARALLLDDAKGMTPEQKAFAGNLALDILHHQEMTPTPEQLKSVKDAIGKAMSPLGVARANALLDAAIK
jgi:hypothetical protein